MAEIFGGNYLEGSRVMTIITVIATTMTTSMTTMITKSKTLASRVLT